METELFWVFFLFIEFLILAFDFYLKKDYFGKKSKFQFFCLQLVKFVSFGIQEFNFQLVFFYMQRIVLFFQMLNSFVIVFMDTWNICGCTAEFIHSLWNVVNKEAEIDKSVIYFVWLR